MNIQFTLTKFMSEPWCAKPSPASCATSGRLSVDLGVLGAVLVARDVPRFGEIRSSAALRSAARLREESDDGTHQGGVRVVHQGSLGAFAHCVPQRLVV